MKLSPCPFCGGKSIKTRRLSEMLGGAPGPLDYYKNCEDCDACGPLGIRPTSAGALWNHRAPQITRTKAHGSAQPHRNPISAPSAAYGAQRR